MHPIFTAICIALVGVSALPGANAADRGSYTVSGLGTRKQAILKAGGNTLDLAIAMLETDNMGTDYVYGDAKTLDSANFGIFKQNWGMLRVCASRAGFAGKSESQWNDGAKLNSDLYADVASRWDCQEYYGYDVWFAGHRNGASGLTNPDTADIKTYKNAVQWIQEQIDSNSKYQSDDTRFWVDVTAI
ncbi:hypothetical protein BGZ61DRAFT_395717 [Ilyonectria robusta]|uniref:uncharacterized protein n=1 Tax=Ilyonectria robusta TaxID=1079257 RepID=UPI001E8D6853|nr:uncharacterized protein BGZ61DRAFT_395717 [Ilyonectria robusta]KAH8680387.1 hypothetical protein BGZ61DRAFT_395717 [Ilyonectria robusta]